MVTPEASARKTERQDLVTRAFALEHVHANFAKGPRAQILRRLLTPDLGTFEYFAKRRVLVVKDTKSVVDAF